MIKIPNSTLTLAASKSTPTTILVLTLIGYQYSSFTTQYDNVNFDTSLNTGITTMSFMQDTLVMVGPKLAVLDVSTRKILGITSSAIDYTFVACVDNKVCFAAGGVLKTNLYSFYGSTVSDLVSSFKNDYLISGVYSPIGLHVFRTLSAYVVATSTFIYYKNTVLSQINSYHTANVTSITGTTVMGLPTVAIGYCKLF